MFVKALIVITAIAVTYGLIQKQPAPTELERQIHLDLELSQDITVRVLESDVDDSHGQAKVLLSGDSPIIFRDQEIVGEDGARPKHYLVELAFGFDQPDKWVIRSGLRTGHRTGHLKESPFEYSIAGKGFQEYPRHLVNQMADETAHPLQIGLSLKKKFRSGDNAPYVRTNEIAKTDSGSQDKSPEKKLVNKKSSQKKKPVEKKHPAAQAFEKMARHISKFDAGAAAKVMTSGAADEYAADRVMRYSKKLDGEFKKKFPKYTQGTSAVASVLKEHELLEFVKNSRRMPKMKLTYYEYQKTNSKTRNYKIAKKLYDAVLELMDQKGNRWKILSDVLEAESKEQGPVLEFYEGTVEQTKIIRDGVAALTVLPATRNNESLETMKAMLPRVIVLMKEVDGKWKFDGVDTELSEKAIRNSPLFKMGPLLDKMKK